MSISDLANIVKILKKLKKSDFIKNDPEVVSELDFLIIKLVKDN